MLKNENIIFTNQVENALTDVVKNIAPRGIFVLADTNTAQFVLPRLQNLCEPLYDATVIRTNAGDASKNIEAATQIWQALVNGGATRKSLLINVGGGMVTDLGGFAAATFKRGMHCVNIPTTLLGAVDAAVGGKTAINLLNCKNLVGVFSEPDAVIISTVFFATLTQQELLSGYAEVIKHAMLSGTEDFSEVMGYDLTSPGYDPDGLLQLLQKSISVKTGIVARDPREKGLRKALNLGHTVGHAFESLALERKSPVPHGYAVANGLVAETVLSSMLEDFDSSLLHTLDAYIRERYPAFAFTCDDYPRLLAFMAQDKKNDSPDAINFTLLHAPGQPVIDVTVAPDKITAALDVYRDLMGL